MVLDSILHYGRLLADAEDRQLIANAPAESAAM